MEMNYTFGDSEAASHRLKVVAQTFAPAMANFRPAKIRELAEELEIIAAREDDDSQIDWGIRQLVYRPC